MIKTGNIVQLYRQSPSRTTAQTQSVATSTMTTADIPVRPNFLAGDAGSTASWARSLLAAKAIEHGKQPSTKQGDKT